MKNIDEITDIELNREVLNKDIEKVAKMKEEIDKSNIENSIHMAGIVDTKNSENIKTVEELSSKRKEKPKVRVDVDTLDAIRDKMRGKTDSERITNLWHAYISNTKSTVDFMKDNVPELDITRRLEDIERIKQVLDMFADSIVMDAEMYALNVKNNVIGGNLEYIEKMRSEVSRECIEVSARAHDSEDKLKISSQKIADLEDKVKELTNKLEEEKESSRKTIEIMNTLQKDIKNKDEKIDELSKKVDEKTAENTDLKRKISELEIAYNDKVTTLKDSHIEDMRHLKEITKEELKKLKMENEKLRNDARDIEIISMKLEFANSKVAGLEEDKSNLINDKNSLQREKELLQNEIQQLKKGV